MSSIDIKNAPEYLRKARLTAGYANRSTAAVNVPYSQETIGRHERGDVPMAPEDVIQYAECYKQPDLVFWYCTNCPIGKFTGKKVTERPLPLATLRVKHMIKEARAVADRLEEIAFDGSVDTAERADFDTALDTLRTLGETINDMILLAATTEKGKAAPEATGTANHENYFHHQHIIPVGSCQAIGGKIHG